MSHAPAERNRWTAGIRAVILDYGEVLCHRPPPQLLSRMAGALGLDQETFASRYEQQRGPYDRGDLAPADYWSAVAVTSQLDVGLLGKLRQWDVEIWSDIDRDMTEWLDRVRLAGFKTALLSNMHSDMAAYVRRTFDWLRRVDCPILSCELRLIKPDRAIYERCLERLSVQPPEALFIDDRETNVRAASDAGLLAVRFESAEQLRRDLSDMGFPVLPLARTGNRPSAV